MSGDVDVDALHKASTDAMLAVMIEDADRFGEAIETIVAMGPVAVHSALYAWSVITLSGTGWKPGTDTGGFWGLQVEDRRTGEVVSADRLSDAAARDAARLVACAGNDDHGTIAAIVQAAGRDAETLTSLMVQSVKLAASMAQQLHEKRAEGGDSDG